MPPRDLIRYLITKRLVGNTIILMSLKNYFIDNISPSEIGRRYRVDKFVVRRWIDKCLKECGSHSMAADILSATFKHILELNPIVLPIGGKYYCLLCDEVLDSEVKALHHVKTEHRNLLDDIVSKLLWAGVRA